MSHVTRMAQNNTWPWAKKQRNFALQNFDVIQKSTKLIFGQFQFFTGKIGLILKHELHAAKCFSYKKSIKSQPDYYFLLLLKPFLIPSIVFLNVFFILGFSSSIMFLTENS